jgi:hypothetical protein
MSATVTPLRSTIFGGVTHGRHLRKTSRIRTILTRLTPSPFVTSSCAHTPLGPAAPQMCAFQPNLRLCHETGGAGAVESNVTNVLFRVGFGEMWEKQKVSYFNDVLNATRRLQSQHDQVTAGKLVASELRKARRARCRKRFTFWASVAAQLAEVTGARQSSGLAGVEENLDHCT